MAENEMMGNHRSIAMVEPGELGPGRGRKQCKNCLKYMGVRVAKCIHCGTEFPVKSAVVVPTEAPVKVRKPKEPNKEETVVVSKGFRSVAIPSCFEFGHKATFCPVKLQGTTFEQVGEWADKVLASGEQKQLRYLPSALRYFLRHQFDIFSKEWREAAVALTEWVSINIGEN